MGRESIFSPDQLSEKINELFVYIRGEHGSEKLDDLALIGVSENGSVLSQEIGKRFKLGNAACTAYQMDPFQNTLTEKNYRRREAGTNIMRDLSGFDRVVLVDAAVVTGYTMAMALTEIKNYGREKRVEIATLVDFPGLKSFPIGITYSGLSLDDKEHGSSKSRISQLGFELDLDKGLSILYGNE